MKKDRWRDVKIDCEKPMIPMPPEVPIYFMAPRIVTARKVKELMITHFGEPRPAQRAHAAYRAWEMDNLKHRRLFEFKTPMTAEAMLWKRFETAVREWHIAEEDRGIMHGQVRHDNVDFSGLDRKQSRGRSL
jgi:hypothetical protein